MRFAPVLLLVMGSLAVGCFSAPYGDAGVEAGEGQERTFDVGTSSNEICPGDLYNAASNNLAVCTHAPEMCSSGAADAANPVQCACTAASSDGGTGRWSCFQAH